MPGKAKSKARKKMEVRRVKHKAKKQAVATYQNEKAEAGKRGARQFETSLGPTSRTIQRQEKGGRAIEDFNKSKRALLEAENDVFVEHILQLSASGFPPSHKEIIAMANEIIKARDPSFPGVGTSWSGRLLKDMPPIPWPPTPEHLKASAEIIPDDDMEDREDFGSDMEMIDGEELT